MNSLNKSLLALIVVLAIVFGLFAAIPKAQETSLTREQAFSAVTQDVYQNTPENAEIRVISESQQGGQWLFSVLVTTDPHSACPSLELRDYSLLPVRYRPEELIKNCKANLPIIYREEALIHAAEGDSFTQGAFGCAFFLSDFNAGEALKYCPALDLAEFDSFSSASSEAAWVIQWTKDGRAQFVALDKNGNVLRKNEVGLQE